MNVVAKYTSNTCIFTIIILVFSVLLYTFVKIFRNMRQVFEGLYSVRKRRAWDFDISEILKQIIIIPQYDADKVGRCLNLGINEIKEILTHVRIELIDDKYIPEAGIEYLADREVGKIKRYFEQSIANYSSLSDKDKRTFDAFIKRYGKRGRIVKRWSDLRIEVIRKDCNDELRGLTKLTFYDGKYICYEELTNPTDVIWSNSLFHQIRHTLMYNMKSLRQWITFRLIVNTTVIYTLAHHFHIFTTDDSNSILTAEENIKWNLPQNAKHYILAARGSKI